MTVVRKYNIYQGETIEWLLNARSTLRDILKSGAGSQTGVALERGMSDQFATMQREEIITALKEVDYALFCADPDTYADPYGLRAGQTIPIFQR